MKFITQDAMDNAVLFKLFVHAQSSDDRLKKEQIATLFDMVVSPKRIELALDNLVRRELVTRYATGPATIEVAGYKFVEEQLAKSESFIRRYAEQGDSWLESQTISLDGVPASNRIVLRSDNQAAIVEIQKGLDEIEGILDHDNEIGDILGKERDVLKGEIEASKTLTRASAFRISRLVALLVPVLKYLGEKFSGSAVGEAAKSLMHLIIGLI